MSNSFQSTRRLSFRRIYDYNCDGKLYSISIQFLYCCSSEHVTNDHVIIIEYVEVDCFKIVIYIIVSNS